MLKPIECSVFSGNIPLTGKVVRDHRVNGGSEVIKDKSKSIYNWDGPSSVTAKAGCRWEHQGVAATHLRKDQGCQARCQHLLRGPGGLLPDAHIGDGLGDPHLQWEHGV